MALTAKQRAFVREYAKDFNASQAAERVGLTADYGRQLLTKTHVRAAIEELREAAHTNAVLSLTQLQEWWSAAVKGEHPDAEYRDRQKASEMLAKSHGGFTDKVEHTFKRDPRELSDDELEAALADAGLTE